MADKSIEQLTAAESIYASDLFVLQQSGTAKKLTGQILINWLTAAADGHGGISTVQKVSTTGIVDTYRITFADTSTFDFSVTNGKGITSIKNTGTSGLVDTYTIQYNDGTSSTFTVTNGEKGDKGDNQYAYVKYASQEPTEESHSFGDVPDQWIGIYVGGLSEAPEDWQEYSWYKIKGDVGDTGTPAMLMSSSVMYQQSDSGTIIPSGGWTASIPTVAPGNYLWTRTTLQFNSGSPVTSYAVARVGMDGSGAVSTVAGISPNADGNVPLDAADINALSTEGGIMSGTLDMNGQIITGINAPVGNNDAVNKLYVDTSFYPAEQSEDYPNCYYRTVSGVAEWINPPMVLGTEYRTTERYNGKVVYTKAVNCGKFPTAGTMKTVSHGVSGATQFISCKGFTDYLGLTLPYYQIVSGNISVVANTSVTKNAIVVFNALSAWTGFDCYVVLKYIKD